QTRCRLSRLASTFPGRGPGRHPPNRACGSNTPTALGDTPRCRERSPCRPRPPDDPGGAGRRLLRCPSRDELRSADPTVGSHNEGRSSGTAAANLDLALTLVASCRFEEAAEAARKAILSGRVVPSNRWRALEIMRSLEGHKIGEARELREALG